MDRAEDLLTAVETVLSEYPVDKLLYEGDIEETVKVCVLIHVSSLMLFNMCPHDVIACVLTRFQMCPHVCRACVLMLSNMCPHDAMFFAFPSHYRGSVRHARVETLTSG